MAMQTFYSFFSFGIFDLWVVGRALERHNQRHFILIKDPLRLSSSVAGNEAIPSRAKIREHDPHRSRLSFSTLSSELSRLSTHCLNCVSRTRHCPPTLNAGSSPLRIIRCNVRVETCRRFAASERVSKQMFSGFSSIEKSSEGAQRNADASKNLHLTD